MDRYPEDTWRDEV